MEEEANPDTIRENTDIENILRSNFKSQPPEQFQPILEIVTNFFVTYPKIRESLDWAGEVEKEGILSDLILDLSIKVNKLSELGALKSGQYINRLTSFEVVAGCFGPKTGTIYIDSKLLNASAGKAIEKALQQNIDLESETDDVESLKDTIYFVSGKTIIGSHILSES